VEAQNVRGIINTAGDGIVTHTISFDAIIHADGASSISFPTKVGVIIRTLTATIKEWRDSITIASADTWTHGSFTVPASTDPTFTTVAVNGEYSVGIGLYGGSNRTAGVSTSWGNDNESTAITGAAQMADATNNYLGFTNIQCEVGSIETDFAQEDITTTLQKCYRYYQRWNITTAFGQIASGYNAGTTTSRYTLPTRQTMRAAPTLGVSNVADFQVQDGGGAKDTTNVTLNVSYPETVQIDATVATQTVSLATVFGADNSTSRWLALSAEL
jgi:hypothetical protein